MVVVVAVAVVIVVIAVVVLAAGVAGGAKVVMGRGSCMEGSFRHSFTQISPNFRRFRAAIFAGISHQ